MSKYTTEVRYICEVSAGLSESKGFNDVDDILNSCCDPDNDNKVFNFDYPLFDETYRVPFEKKILRHFYTREICEESVGLWKLRMQNRLCEIMPYYNKLYESDLLDFNPFYDVDFRTEHKGESVDNELRNRNGSENENSIGGTKESDIGSETRNKHKLENEMTNRENVKSRENNVEDVMHGNEGGEGTRTTDNWDLYSDTPQGGINGMTPMTGNNYLTNARNVKDNEKNDFMNSKQEVNNKNEQEERNENEKIDGSVNSITDEDRAKNRNINKDDYRVKANNSVERSSKLANNLNEYAEHVIGKRGEASYSKLLMEFRESFLNIDAMVINELNDLFFGLWE